MPPRNDNELIPSAKRLIGSLRDLGYEFAPAVADLIDNAIEARASEVDVWIEFKGDESWVRISDNGDGMRAKVLREAMRYGSNRDYDASDLGKFGLGMKTASMSQCRCLTVASRRKDEATVAAYQWDLEHIQKTDRWEVLPLEPKKFPRPLHAPLKKGASTVVLWEQLDRILGYKHPYGEFQRKQLAQMSREVEEHLAMVFHRYLAGQAKRRVKITLNGHPVDPWDPFCRAEPRTRQPERRTLPVAEDGVKGEVLFEPYVLPNEKHFSSPEAREIASGPRKWNRQQGLYIYRADRLIQSGGWSGLRVPDEHTKLARVAISFSPKLDEAFKINVAKMRVQLPAQLKPELERLLLPVIRAAKAEYNAGGHEPSSSGRGNAPTAVTPVAARAALAVPPLRSSGEAGGDTAIVVARTLFTVAEIEARALDAATTAEAPVIRAVFARMKN